MSDIPQFLTDVCSGKVKEIQDKMFYKTAIVHDVYLRWKSSSEEITIKVFADTVKKSPNPNVNKHCNVAGVDTRVGGQVGFSFNIPEPKKIKPSKPSKPSKVAKPVKVKIPPLPILPIRLPCKSGKIMMYSSDLQDHVISHINNHTKIVGCVAWVTNKFIITALATKTISLVVTKELESWKKGSKLRDLYKTLKPGVKYVDSSSSSYVHPLMHNKFLVFMDTSGKPCSVWTGSFNFTKNATISYENALYIKDDAIAAGYYQLWNDINNVAKNV